MESIRIVNARLVNEGTITEKEVLIRDGFIAKIGDDLSGEKFVDRLIDANGSFLLPGVIDDQVHFREPGLTHKAEIYTEAKAAVAGGVTTYMEMPNTKPSAVTNELLEEKYKRANEVSLANYSFYLGTTNTNLEEIKKVDAQNVCGIKIFMGSSTGNMVIDDEKALENIFKEAPILVATHCEDDPMIQGNLAAFREKYGEGIHPKYHPYIRSEDACYKSSSKAVGLARKYGTRLHILHISTAKELELFDNSLPLTEKKITAEACIHHMWFSEEDYETKGNLIKWNPAVKKATDRDAIFQAVLDNKIDVIATDHAPHTKEEKAQGYFDAPSGGPLIQHTLQAMMDFYHQGKISMERIVEKMCHAPALMFDIEDRGFIREGYWADLVLADPNKSQLVTPESLHYKCGWSPFEGHTFGSSVTHTIVSGHLAFENGKFNEAVKGKRLKFKRG